MTSKFQMLLDFSHLTIVGVHLLHINNPTAKAILVTKSKGKMPLGKPRSI
jgi:hypothetical protein